MSITPPSLSRIEKSESDGSTTLRTLERAAAALRCRLVYLLVPEEGTFGALREAQALEFARRTVEQVAESMRLEDQAVARDVQEEQIRQLAETLCREYDKRIWEPPA